ncbi:MAG: filamentous hemagglutinin N-terminal domain-containing protein [Spirulina sp. SIO3F2]|nr:filamentous hemagglutinin N-terminal domain-containing protein [Spirulina sp. SIO3F2]
MNIIKSEILLPLLTGLLGSSLGLNAQAQLMPDNTLGGENSVVTPVDALNDRIDGGATRGANLFHSFQEFNVGNGRGVYFANPGSINNILTRVTGNNISEIFGTLGVLGDANLWLINPNGIHFGPNASLDIRGSFTATTADGVWLGTEQFSATNPQAPPLLAIEPGALFVNQLADYQTQIRSEAELVTGANLTLDAAHLDLEGQLRSGGDLNLLATDTVKIRDSAPAPFIALAGNALLVQGNDAIDIFALNHLNSGFFAGHDLVVRSDNAVIGDAYYYAGGDFRVERLNQSLGALISPNDPVIRTAGDVFLNTYLGASLHIIAGGHVKIPGFIRIESSDPVNGLTETITLSNGQSITINGKTEPTLDIRAGVHPDAIGLPAYLLSGGTFSPVVTPPLAQTPTSADIVVGRIQFGFGFAPLAGTVLITNQYQPNPALVGDIVLAGNGGAILNGNLNSGGDIYVDSRGQLNVEDFIFAAFINSPIPTYLGSGGDITLLAAQDLNLNADLVTQGVAGGTIELTSGGIVRADDVLVLSRNVNPWGGQPTGGGITVQAQSLVAQQSSWLSDTFIGSGHAGPITIDTTDQVRFQGEKTFPLGVIGATTLGGGVMSGVSELGIGDTGRVRITAGTLEVLDGAVVSTAMLGQGTGGHIDIDVQQTVRIQGENPATGLASTVGSVLGGGAIGQASDIDLNVPVLEVLDGGAIASTTGGLGNSGQITLRASESVRLQGEGSLSVSGIFSSIAASATGNAAPIAIETRRLQISDGAVVDASTFGQGNAAAIAITAPAEIGMQGSSRQNTPSGIFSAVAPTASGNTGNISLNTDRLMIMDRAELSVSSFNGNAGVIAIAARTTAINNGRVVSQSLSGQRGGDIRFTGQTLTLRNHSRISAITAGVAGGNLQFEISDYTLLRNGSFISTQAGSRNQPGNGGNITFNGGGFLVSNFRENNDIVANAFGGRGGNITINSSGIYGLAFRDLQFPRNIISNDITASSDIGLNGVQTFNRLSFPAEQGLNELPDSLVDAEDILRRDFCAVQDSRIAGGTSFTVTGRGGIPLSPDDPSDADADLTPWATRPDRVHTAPVVIQEREPNQPLDYRQAQGWQVDENGQVWLTADRPDATTPVPTAAHPDCHDFNMPLSTNSPPTEPTDNL